MKCWKCTMQKKYVFKRIVTQKIMMDAFVLKFTFWVMCNCNITHFSPSFCNCAQQFIWEWKSTRQLLKIEFFLFLKDHLTSFKISKEKQQMSLEVENIVEYLICWRNLCYNNWNCSVHNCIRSVSVWKYYIWNHNLW